MDAPTPHLDTGDDESLRGSLLEPRNGYVVNDVLREILRWLRQSSKPFEWYHIHIAGDTPYHLVEVPFHCAAYVGTVKTCTNYWLAAITDSRNMIAFEIWCGPDCLMDFRMRGKFHDDTVWKRTFEGRHGRTDEAWSPSASGWGRSRALVRLIGDDKRERVVGFVRERYAEIARFADLPREGISAAKAYLVDLHRRASPDAYCPRQ